MGISLEDVLEELKQLSDTVDYFLSCIGYKPTDIENMISDLEQKLREANESR